jgi:hypothetical protein
VTLKGLHGRGCAARRGSPGVLGSDRRGRGGCVVVQILDAHLLDKTYLVGQHVTLADLTVASALFYPFKLVMSPEYRAQFPNVTRWFLTTVNQPNFKAVTGERETTTQTCHTPRAQRRRRISFCLVVSWGWGPVASQSPTCG